MLSKRIRTVILVLCIAMLLTAVMGMNCTVYAMEAVKPTGDYPDFILTLGEVNEAEENFTVLITLEAGANLAAGDFAVNYDVEQIVCTAVTSNRAVTSAGAYLVAKENIGEGTVNFSYVNTKPFTDEVMLMTLTFRITEGFSGGTVISSSGRDMVDAGYNDIQLDFLSLTYEPVSRLLAGDVNLDGQVTAADLTALARHVAKIELITHPDSLANAEVAGGSQLSAEDLTRLARHVAKIDSLT